MAYGDFKDLKRRTAADKALNIAKNPKCYGYQRELASMVYKLFNKKTSRGTVNNEIISNKELAEQLHKPVIKKYDKSKMHSSFRQYLGRRSSRHAIYK